METAHDEGEEPKVNCRKMVLIAIGVVVLVGIITIVCVVPSLPRTEVHPAIETTWSSADIVRIHSRQEWGARPVEFRTALMHPTPLVVISDTVTPPCNSFWSCSDLVLSIQEFHMNRKSLSDIGYNFLVGGDGSIFEGRGWDTTNMHTGFVRNCNLAVSFIGSFSKDRPSEKQVNSVLQLLDMGVFLGKISSDYKLLAMNQTAMVPSPGPALYSVIKQWPHHWVATEHDTAHCPFTV